MHFRGVATGVYRYIYPPNQSSLNFLCGCFVSLTQDKFDIVQFIRTQIKFLATPLMHFVIITRWLFCLCTFGNLRFACNFVLVSFSFYSRCRHRRMHYCIASYRMVWRRLVLCHSVASNGLGLLLSLLFLPSSWDDANLSSSSKAVAAAAADVMDHLISLRNILPHL